MANKHVVRVFEVDDAGKETEIFMQRTPEENLRGIFTAASAKPRKARTTAAPKQGATK